MFSVVVGGTLESSGGLVIEGGWTRLAETWAEALSSETLFATNFLVQDWSFILDNLVLNWSTIVPDAVISFRHM